MRVPNGGIDNCGTCPYNKANEGKPEWVPYYVWQKGEVLHFCTLRKIKINDPYWTYCWNHQYVASQREVENPLPVGPVFVSGLSEPWGPTYTRIPWDIKTKISIYVESKNESCPCGKKVKEGIRVVGEKFSLFFCSNKCYMKWWEKTHPGELTQPHWKGQRLFPAVKELDLSGSHD